MRPLTKILTAASLFIGTAGIAAAAPTDRGLGFQDPATPVMENLVGFHDYILMPIITGICVFVLALMIYIMIRFNKKANPVPSKTSHNTLLEVVWTIIPVIILLIIVVPSMQLLYYQDRIPETELTVKATGNTWNWEYAYPDYENIDSFISNPLEREEADAEGRPYLLAADAAMVVPVNTKVKVLVTSNNNMHSFTVPQFGIKMDAVPGRINETWFEVTEEGTYYGQCSEVCGVLHYKMPIEVEVVSKERFAQWVANGGAFDAAVAENEMGGASLAAANE